MFPYPSGELLHVGRWFAYIPADARARFLRMRGCNVLFPIGFDAFGLPAENAAIRRGIHPYRWTMENIVEMRRQFRSMGAMWDWDREIVTCDPAYYRWNQWFFLKMYERGLAYRAVGPVDWCPRCNTSLAREQVVGAGRLCERCDTPVVKRTLEQWFLRITAYAEELLDFSQIEWPERIRTLQKNWIGRSEGVEFSMSVADHPGLSLHVFTTRPDTVYGMTFVVVAPEHPLVDVLTAPERRVEVETYKYKAARASDIERLSTEKGRDGVAIGAEALHPLSGERVPIFIADYVLLTHGTGAIQGVPAHDQRDYEFAVKCGLPIPVVVAPPGWDGAPLSEAYLGAGTMVHSGRDRGIAGITRFLRRVWSVVVDPAPHKPHGASDPAELRRRTHRVIRQVTEDLERFRFNTALAVLMEFTGFLKDVRGTAAGDGPAWREAVRTLLLLLAPFVPHLAEELWEAIGEPYSIHRQPWPSYDPDLLQVEMVTLVVQVNGRVRDRLTVPSSTSDAEAQRLALQSPRVRQVLAGRGVSTAIVVPGRLVNLVVREE